MEMNKLTLEEEQAIKQRCQKPNKGEWEGGLVRFECPLCGKMFYITSLGDWTYKRRIKQKATALLYICSYPCLRKYDSIFG